MGFEPTMHYCTAVFKAAVIPFDQLSKERKKRLTYTPQGFRSIFYEKQNNLQKDYRTFVRNCQEIRACFRKIFAVYF